METHFVVFSYGGYGGMGFTEEVMQQIGTLYHVPSEVQDNDRFFDLEEYKEMFQMTSTGFVERPHMIRKEKLWIAMCSDYVRATNDPEVVDIVRQANMKKICMQTYPIEFLHCLHCNEYDGCESIRPMKERFIFNEVCQLPVVQELERKFDTLRKSELCGADVSDMLDLFQRSKIN